jgi:hypothetical protein
MSVTIKADIGGADSNSYISLTDAETYFSLRSPAAPNWTAETADDDKSKALITATRLLDQLIEWDGEVVEETQALLWPRSGLYNAKEYEIHEDEIPPEIGYAVCEFAETLLVTDKTVDLTTQGIRSLGVGSINVEFMEGQPPVRTVIPDIVWEFVQRWGHRLDASIGSATIIRA